MVTIRSCAQCHYVAICSMLQCDHGAIVSWQHNSPVPQVSRQANSLVFQTQLALCSWPHTCIRLPIYIMQIKHSMFRIKSISTNMLYMLFIVMCIKCQPNQQETNNYATIQSTTSTFRALCAGAWCFLGFSP